MAGIPPPWPFSAGFNPVAFEFGCRYQAIPKAVSGIFCRESPRSAAAETCAKLRSDLEIRSETDDPKSSVVVKDPITLRLYRFTWMQAKVLGALDGRRDSGAVAADRVLGTSAPAATSPSGPGFLLRIHEILISQDFLRILLT